MKPLGNTLFKRKPSLLIFDWANFVARAVKASEPRGPNGERGDPVGWDSLIAKMLVTRRENYPSAEFVFAFEGHGTDLRKEIYEDYKCSRTEVGKRARSQRVEEAKEICWAMGCKTARASDGEADDAIAAYLRHYADNYTTITIESNDRDLWQLIHSPKIKVVSGGVDIDEQHCHSTLGVTPTHIPMLKALLGDKSDDILRVPRVRTARLKALAQACKVPKDIPAAIEKLVAEKKISKNDVARIEHCKRQINMNYKITQLWDDVELWVQDYKPNIKALQKFIGRRELTREDMLLLARGGRR
jgi:5'-3' exonuclease